jgi:hypothetical protein
MTTIQINFQSSVGVYLYFLEKPIINFYIMILPLSHRSAEFFLLIGTSLEPCMHAGSLIFTDTFMHASGNFKAYRIPKYGYYTYYKNYTIGT